MSTPIDDWVSRIRAAHATRAPLRLRGGGTKDFWGGAQEGEVLEGDVLDTRTHSGIVSYEPTELVVTVRAGTPVAELEAVLLARGQCLAFEPPLFEPPSFGPQLPEPALPNASTCGGMVAAGLSGPARASVGAVRDYVLGVEMINGRGQLLRFGGQVMKNVAGYDVSRLMVGAWGTLGLLTEVSLKVLPIAPAEATLLAHGLSQRTALDLLNRWGGQPLPLNASCWLAPHPGDASPGSLYLRLRGAVAAVHAAGPRLLAELEAAGAVAQMVRAPEATPHWQSCRHQTHAFFTPPGSDLCLWRLSVPQTAPAFDLPYAQCVEWHGAQRWLWAAADAAPTLQAAAQRVGGTASIFRAYNPYVTRLGGQNHSKMSTNPGTALGAIHHRLQAEFDPAHIFNPARMPAPT